VFPTLTADIHLSSSDSTRSLPEATVPKDSGSSLKKIIARWQFKE
jgi:hypothetical protein